MDNDRLELKAVINHLGETMKAGHYVAMCRDKPHQWHLFDDTTTSKISENDIQTGDAYILIYEETKLRRSDRQTLKSQKLREAEQQNQEKKNSRKRKHSSVEDDNDKTLPYGTAVRSWTVTLFDPDL